MRQNDLLFFGVFFGVLFGGKKDGKLKESSGDSSQVKPKEASSLRSTSAWQAE